jgi:DNA-binding beta-propeller fold protein YncE
MASLRKLGVLTGVLAVLGLAGAAAAAPPSGLAAVQRPMTDLKPTAVLKLGKTADWVVIAGDAVWVGSTGPNAVHRIDPKTNRVAARTPLPGDPCAYMAAGFGALWAPLCGEKPSLAKVDLKTGKLVAVFPVGTASESGIVASGDSLWMVTDAAGTLARLDPADGRVRQTTKVAAGSFNPVQDGGVVYVSDVAAALVTAVDAKSGAIRFTAATGPNPRFMTVGGGALWTLNQGDGSLSRVALDGKTPATAIALGTPGHGGDIAFGAGMVWTTMIGVPLTATDARTGKVRRQWVGPGGDSLAVGFGSIWLTDFRGGTVSRIPLTAATAP